MTTIPIKRIEVVAAVILRGEQVLCVQRGISPRDYVSKKWEFPGGKIEAGEAGEVALAREIAEELHLHVQVTDRLITVDHTYPHFHITMHAYQCQIVDPTQVLTLTEHLDHRWLTPDSADFGALDWAAADVPIVDLLRRRHMPPKG